MSANIQSDKNIETIVVDSTELLPPASPFETGWTSLLPMVLIFVVFYFLLIRPQEKKRKAQEELVNGVKKGEEVVTHSGIYGKIVAMNDSDGTISLLVADDVTIKVLKSAVADVVSRKATSVSTASEHPKAHAKTPAKAPAKKEKKSK